MVERISNIYRLKATISHNCYNPFIVVDNILCSVVSQIYFFQFLSVTNIIIINTSSSEKKRTYIFRVGLFVLGAVIKIFQPEKRVKFDKHDLQSLNSLI